MNLRLSPSWRVMLTVVVALTAATLACMPGAGGAATTAPTTAATEVSQATDAPTEAVEPTDAPTEAVEPTADATEAADTGGDDGGAKNDGGTTGGDTTTGGTTGGSGSPDAITASNAGDVTQLCGVQVTETALLAITASPDTHEIVTFGFDKIPRIFDGDDCALLGGLEPMADYGWGIAYSPDGTQIAVGGGFQVRLYNASTGAVDSRATVNSFVYKTVWYPTGEELAVVGDASSRIEVIDAVTGAAYDPISSPDGIILWSIAFTPDGKFMVTGNGNGGIRVFDLDTGDIAFETQTKGAVYDLEFSSDGSRMAACNGSGHVYVWDTTSWDISLSSEISGDPVHQGGCQDGAFSPDGTVYVTAGTDGYINFFDSSSGENLNYFWWEGLPSVSSVAFTGDGELVAVTLMDGGMGVFSLP